MPDNATLPVTTLAPSTDKTTASLTVVTAVKPDRLAKRLRLDPDGRLEKIAAGQLLEGTARRKTVRDLAHLAEGLTRLEPNQALTYGVTEAANVRIITEAAWKKRGRPDTDIPRTRRNFAWPAGPGILQIDHDPPKGGTALTREGLIGALRDAAPALADVGMLWWPSASSHIVNTTTDEDLTGLRGQRVYMIAKDARDIERAGAVLFRRLWLAGYGHVEISGAGSLLVRSPIDPMVYQPERLDFAAGAVCEAPLEQRRGEPVLIPGTNGVVDTKAAIPDLTADEDAQVKGLIAAAKADAKAEANLVREAWLDNRAAEIAGNDADDAQLAAARRTASRAVEARTLLAEFRVSVFVDGDAVSLPVGELLKDPNRWHGALTLDPLEPEYGGHKPVGKLFLHGAPTLFSFAHGGASYRLLPALREVQLVTGRTNEAVDNCLAALREDPTTFDFGDALATVENGKIFSLDEHAGGYHIGSRAQFWRYHQPPKAKEAKRQLEDPPPRVVRPILSLKSRRNLKPLTAVITAPTMRLDGSVLDVPGYDPATQLLFDTHDEPGPVLDQPTLAQANAALATLWVPFREFPFVGPADKGILLAAILTAALRPSLPTAPGFAFDAPTQGSGKTLLARCIAILATGGEASVWPHTKGRDDEETRKRVFAALLAGTRAIIWDNATGIFDSPSLAAALTSPVFEDRVLAKSESRSVPNRALFLLTGNNLALGGEMPRRILLSRIDPQTEEPFAREFDLDPAAHCRARRGDMIAAALTLIRAYLGAGAVRAAGNFASFEDWDRLVRQTVVWAGGELAGGEFGDPIDGVREAVEADPKTQDIGAVLEALWAWQALRKEETGAAHFTAKDVGQVYFRGASATDDGPPPRGADRGAYFPVCNALEDALRAALPGGRHEQPKIVGNFLMRWRDRIVGGRRVRAAGKAANKVTQFVVEEVG